MTDKEEGRAPGRGRQAGRGCSTASPTPRNAPAPGITVYGCDRDEAAAFRELAPRFGIAVTVTTAAASEATVALASGNRCISVGHRTRVTRSTLLALRRAGVVHLSTRSVGCDHIDVAYAHNIGVRVRTVAYSPASVADYTLMLILMVVRHAKPMMRRTAVHDYRLHEYRGRELRDLTVGVVGTGRIGSAVMERLRGFGCQTLAHDRRPAGGVRHVPLDDLLRESDVVTLHTPLTAQTRHLLDRRRIGLLRSGACVVNTGRGELIDTGTLLPALESGWLGGAALDVVEGEDGVFYSDHRHTAVGNAALVRLQSLPNVIVSPHTAYYTEHALSDVVENTLVDCVTFEKGSMTWTS